METLIETLNIDRKTEKLVSITESYEELSPHSFSNDKFDEFIDMMADQFIKFKKAQRSDLNEKS